MATESTRAGLQPLGEAEASWSRFRVPSDVGVSMPDLGRDASASASGRTEVDM